jgi:hypothetical protein
MAMKRGEVLEASAKVAVRAHFAPQIKLALRIFNLGSEIIQLPPEGEKLSKCEIVRRLLLQRIVTDLRCSTILSELGYGIQAAAHATSIFEAWVTIAAIKEEADAIRWLNHTRKDISFDKIKKLLRTALGSTPEKKPGDRERLIARHYAHYGELCMTKHLNPIVERARGFVLVGDRTKFVHGPDVSKQGLHHVRFALQSSALHAWFALIAFTRGRRLSQEMLLEMKGISRQIRGQEPQSEFRPIE